MSNLSESELTNQASTGIPALPSTSQQQQPSDTTTPVLPTEQLANFRRATRRYNALEQERESKTIKFQSSSTGRKGAGGEKGESMR
jgi:hypothetical protein